MNDDFTALAGRTLNNSHEVMNWCAQNAVLIVVSAVTLY
jgi:hypothetical protein